MGTGSARWVVRRDARKRSAFVLLVSLGYLSGAACAGRSQSNGPHGSNAGSSTGGVGGATGGAGGGTGGVTGVGGRDVGSEVGGSGNVSGSGAMGGAGVGGASGRGGSGTPGCAGESVVSPNLSTCHGHFAHRPTAAACPPPPPNLERGAGGEGTSGEGGAPWGSAHCDEPCSPGEACIWTTPNEALAAECVSVCETDADCVAGAVCACVPGLFRGVSDPGPGTTVGICRRSTCSVDADCAPGLLCISPFTRSDCGEPWPREFHCQTPNDECAGGDQCPLKDCEYEDNRFICGRDTEFC
jgi:hypothetical protein